MSYNTKIIIVRKTSSINGTEELYFAEKIAEFSLCRMNYEGPYMKILPMMRATNCYYFMDDGNTKVIEDKYGDFIREINLAPLIKILKKEDHSYRHIPAIIGMLESIALHMKDHNLIALHFGH